MRRDRASSLDGLSVDDVELQASSSVLYYDDEELERFVNMMENIRNEEGVTMDGRFLLFAEYVGMIHKGKYVAGMKAPDRKAKMVDLVKACASGELDAEKRDRFLMWFDFVLEKEIPTELVTDIMDHFIWDTFKNSVLTIDSSNIPFSEKLRIRPKKLDAYLGNRDGICGMDQFDITANVDSESAWVISSDQTINSLVRLEKGNFLVFAARPGVGKSLAMINMGVTNAGHGKRCLYVSLEMGGSQLKERALNCVTGVNIRNSCTMNGTLDVRRFKRDVIEAMKTQEWQKVTQNFDMYVTSKSSADAILADIEQEIKNADRPYDIVFLDYLQLLRYATLDEWASLRKLTNSLKNLALRLGIIVVSASQVSRESTERGLYLTSLFGSSTIENDADIIIGLEEFQERRNGTLAALNMKLLKYREGALTEIKIEIDYAICKISSWK